MSLHDDDTHLDELAATSKSLTKRILALAQVAQRRHATAKFIQCVSEAAELTDAATRVVKAPHMPVPTIRNRPNMDPTTHDPRSVAQHMWKTLSEHPDAPADGKETGMTDMAPSVVLRGRCDSVSVAEILEFFGQLAKTGVMWVRGREETFTIQLEEGYVVNAFSNNAPREHLLGNILIAQGSISAEQFDRFLASFSSGKGKIGEALEREQLVTKQQLSEALETQVYLLFERIAQAEKATFTFSERTQGAHDQRLRMSVVHLLLESARMTDEAARS